MRKVTNLGKFILYYGKGLSRNLKLISYGNHVVIYKRRHSEARYGRLYSSRFPRLTMIRFLIKELRVNHSKSILPAGDRVLYCGPTLNNEREFAFLEKTFEATELSRDLCYSRSRNVSFLKAKKVKVSAYEWMLRRLVIAYLIAYSLRVKPSPTMVKFIVAYSRHYMRFYTAFSASGRLPKVAIFANDHNDQSVAFSMVMLRHKVPRLYLQHAEVTDRFPPLDFEISVLRNQVSAETYRTIGKCAGKVFMLPRNALSESFNQIFKSEEPVVDVVLYLSSVFRLDVVGDLIDRLRASEGVRTVRVKTHPRTMREKLQSLGRVSVSVAMPKYEHVAVVPNSSVVVELLSKGVKVFQYFNLDDIENDYYGFVRRGVVPEISDGDIGTRFWLKEFFDEAWVNRYRLYDPSVDDDWKESVSLLREELEASLR